MDIESSIASMRVTVRRYEIELSEVVYTSPHVTSWHDTLGIERTLGARESGLEARGLSLTTPSLDNV